MMGGLRNFDVLARRQRRMLMIFKTLFGAVARALAEAWCPLRTMAVVVDVLGTNDCFIGKGYRRKKWTGQCFMRLGVKIVGVLQRSYDIRMFETQNCGVHFGECLIDCKLL